MRTLPDLSTGDTVRHQSLGTGIVTQIEAGGVVTVRFEDGSERRLMLEYAPLERLGRAMDIEVRPCTSVEELRDAINAISHYFGAERPLEEAERFAQVDRGRAHARGVRRRPDRRRRGRVHVRCRCPAAGRSRPLA